MAKLGGPILTATEFYYPDTVTWSSCVHMVAVEVDPDTGIVGVLKYVMSHDCGVPMNPMVVDGQLQGGTVQGIGAALGEELIYDASGQLLTGSFMDYPMPRAADAALRDRTPGVPDAAQSPRGARGRRGRAELAAGGLRRRGRGCDRPAQTRDPHAADAAAGVRVAALTMGESMQAIRVPRFGGAEVLETAVLPVPRPGPGEVLVRIACAGVNFSDVYRRIGRVREGTPGSAAPIPGPRVAARSSRSARVLSACARESASSMAR
jgi:hypothetical protein